MDCKEFRERLGPYVDGELTAESEGEARGHLKGCVSCAKAEAGLRHLRSSLKRAVNRHEPPPGLKADVLRSLRPSGRVSAGRALDESRRVGARVWRAQVVVPAPLFALLVFSLVVLAGWLVFTRGPARKVAAPPGEESGGSYFSRYYSGERASIQVVRRAQTNRPGR